MSFIRLQQQTNNFADLPIIAQNIFKNIAGNRDCFAQLETSIENLRIATSRQIGESQSTIAAQMTKDNDELMDMLRKIHEETRHSNKARDDYRERICTALRFDTMEYRQDQIEEAYADTYEWALAEEQPEGASWTNLSQWFKSESALYWITGKPGSGEFQA